MRSLLFAPSDSERKIAKAIASEADSVIVDLEDAVAPDAKDAARISAVRALSERRRASVGLRINAIGTPWYFADLGIVGAARPAFVMLPKCVGPADLLQLAHHLALIEAQNGLAPGSIGILPLVTESAAAVAKCEFTETSPRLIGLCFAAEDLSTDLGIEARSPTGALRAPLLHARAKVLLAARAAGVPAFDTPYPRLADPDGLRRDCLASVEDGFAGKLCIHPAQIDPVNEIFSPTTESLAHARRIVQAFAGDEGAGAIALDGAMVDRPHLERARLLLARAGTGEFASVAGQA